MNNARLMEGGHEGASEDMRAFPAKPAVGVSLFSSSAAFLPPRKTVKEPQVQLKKGGGAPAGKELRCSLFLVSLLQFLSVMPASSGVSIAAKCSWCGGNLVALGGPGQCRLALAEICH